MSETLPSTSYHRCADLLGIELLESRAASSFHWYLTRFVWIAPATWDGEVLCHQRAYRLAPGIVLCADPDGACSTSFVTRGGNLSAVFVDPGLIAALMPGGAADPAGSSGSRAPTAGSRAPTFGASGASGSAGARLPTPGAAGGPRERLAALCQRLRSGASRDELWTHLSALLESMGDQGPEQLRCDRHSRLRSALAERLREALDADPRREQSLEDLCERLRVTRFQALRAFKQQHGLTPSAYQMCRRIAEAQTALRRGATPAQAAAELGFSDQSHLGRHFKRVVGMSPGQYARADRAHRAMVDLLGSPDRSHPS